MNTCLQPIPPPTRDARRQMLKRGTRFLEPDVYVARVDGRKAVFKDYRRYRWTPATESRPSRTARKAARQ